MAGIALSTAATGAEGVEEDGVDCWTRQADPNSPEVTTDKAAHFMVLLLYLTGPLGPGDLGTLEAR